MLNKISSMVVIGALFSIIGLAVPYTFNRYAPASFYYYTTEQNAVPPVVEQCNSFKLITNRESRLHTEALLTRNLWNITTGELVDSSKIIILINPGEERAEVKKQIPCDAPLGDYVYESSLKFEVDGVLKTYTYTSEPFRVIPKTSTMIPG